MANFSADSATSIETPAKLPAIVDGMRDVGLRLAELRRRRGLSREAVAELTGLRPATIKRWELLEDLGPKGPSIVDLVTLVRFYGVSLDWLVGMADDPVALPAGYVLVDLAIVEAIRKATRLEHLGADVVPAETVPYAVVVPQLRRLLPPDDPELAALEAEMARKLRQLRGE